MTPDRQALLEAVRYLVESDQAEREAQELDTVVQFARLHPVRFKGDLSTLNPLLDLALTDPATFERIQALINTKRTAAGNVPAWPPEERERFDVRTYQRELMARRRLRVGRVVDVENSLRPERDQIRGNARMEFERVQLKKWGDQLRARLDAARLNSGGRLTKEHLQGITDKFWSGVLQLVELEDAARIERLKPAHQRRRLT